MKILELFAGIGACSKALKRLGIDLEIVDAVEIDKYAIASFNAIHNTNFETQDITTWDKDLKDIDLITHGSPCQDFSIAGKQAGGDLGSGTRSSLMYETIRIVGKIRPKYVLWENVKNILSKKHKHNFEAYIETMKVLEYNSYYKVLDAKDYGVPQHRERVYTISIRKDIDKGNFNFPQKEELKLRLKDLLEDKVDEKYYLSEKMTKFFMHNEQVQKEKGNGFRFGVSDGNIIAKAVTTRAGSRMDDNFIQYNNQRANQTIENHKEDIKENSFLDCYNDKVLNDGTIPTMTSRISTSNNYFIAIKNANSKGYDEATEGDSIDLTYPNSTTRRGRVGHQVSQTILASDTKGVVVKSAYLRNYGSKGKIQDSDIADTLLSAMGEGGGNIPLYNDLRIRKLTPKECWRLMGFDDEDFEKAKNVPTSNTQLYKQARKLNLRTSIRKNIQEFIFGGNMDLDDEELFYTRLKNGSMSKKEMIKKVEEYLDKLSKLDIEKDQTKEKDLMQRLEALRKEMENEQER